MKISNFLGLLFVSVLVGSGGYALACGGPAAETENPTDKAKSCSRYLDQLCYNAVLPATCSLVYYSGKSVQPPVVSKGFNECDAERILKKHLCELNYNVESIPDKDIVCAAILPPVAY